MTHFVRRFLIALLFGVLVYGVFVALSGYRALAGVLSTYEWGAFAAALGLASLNYVLRFLKWEFYLARLEVRGVPKLDSFLVFLSGFALTVTPGKVGEVFKSAVLHETHGVPMAKTAPIVIAERLTDVIAIVALIALGTSGFSGGAPWAVAGALSVLCGLVLILWRPPLDRLAPKARQSVESLRLLASPSMLVWPSILSIAGWGLEGLSLWLIIGGFGVDVPLSLAVFFYATATLAGALIPVPGGLGVAETILQSQLVELGGAPLPIATGAMLMIRFSTLWWAVLVGFGALAILRTKFPTLLRVRSGELATRESN